MFFKNFMYVRNISKFVGILIVGVIVPESAPKKEKFQKSVDTLISVEDENIFLMYSVVRCITSLVGEPGLVGLDFADVKEILQKSGRSYVAYGKEHSVINAMKNAIDSVKDVLSKSKRVLFGVFGRVESLSMTDVHEVSNLMQYSTHPDSEIVWGVAVDLTLADDYAEVIIIATDEK